MVEHVERLEALQKPTDGGKSYAEGGAEKGQLGSIKGRVDISESPDIVEIKNQIDNVEMGR